MKKEQWKSELVSNQSEMENCFSWKVNGPQEVVSDANVGMQCLHNDVDSDDDDDEDNDVNNYDVDDDDEDNDDIHYDAVHHNQCHDD